MKLNFEIKTVGQDFLQEYKKNLINLIKSEIKLKKKIINLYVKDIKKISKKNSNKFLCIEANDQLTKKNFGSTLVNLDKSTGLATIIWIIVKKEYSSNGIGKLLIYKIQKLSKSKKIHKLRVFSYDKKINIFYRKLNFKLEGFHPNHWHSLKFWSFGKKL